MRCLAADVWRVVREWRESGKNVNEVPEARKKVFGPSHPYVEKLNATLLMAVPLGRGLT
jgi:hypothetical protein